jgi:hypothetical protein
MTDQLRKRLKKRAQESVALASGGTPKRLQKTPSQKKSEAMRKKLNRGVIINSLETIMSDCRSCGGLPGCDSDLSRCSMRSVTIRCGKCGQKVRVRIYDDGGERYLCPVCKAQEGRT